MSFAELRHNLIIMKRILIIDDDHDLLRLLTDYLSLEGFECRGLSDGQAGAEELKANHSAYDLVILDVMLPSKNGFEVLNEIRAGGVELPVIMLTAKGDSVDIVVGLEMGADDYLPKPFNPRELLARMRSALRRAPSGPVAETGPKSGFLRLEGFELEEKSYQARFDGRPLSLTPVEFKILWQLLSHPGEVVSRAVLFREALGRRENLFDRSLDMHVSRLRKKVGRLLSGAECFKSIRGEGYIYVAGQERKYEG